MKARSILSIISFIIIIIALVGCNQKSEAESIEDASIIAEDVFTSNSKIENNYETDEFSLYVPNQWDVTEEASNNIILSKGDQTLIVFYNMLESPTSKLNYNNAQNDQAILLETFEDDKKFGYIRIMPENEEEYEMQIGVGGAKITTYTTKRDMNEDAEELMVIAKSIIDNES